VAVPSLPRGGLRKRPLQERSKATTQRILDTAARLVIEVGYEAVVGSPTLLLQESGVSRGSFYSFFETPEKVLDELAFQSMQTSSRRFQELLSTNVITHWLDIVELLIDYYVEQFHDPLTRELWVRQHLTPTVRALDREWVQNLAAEILEEFRKQSPLFDELTLNQCIVAGEILERLFQYAFTDDPDGDPAVIEETRTVLVQYFAAYAGEGPAESTTAKVRRVRATTS
jgi:AcrR family transcriptional regulator